MVEVYQNNNNCKFCKKHIHSIVWFFGTFWNKYGNENITEEKNGVTVITWQVYHTDCAKKAAGLK